MFFFFNLFQNCFNFLNNVFYPSLTSKMAFVACWALRKWWNAARCVVIIVKVKEPSGKFPFAPVIGWKSMKFFGNCTFAGKIYFGVCGMQRHKVEMVASLLVRGMHSDNGTLSPRSLQYWPINHRVQNTTSQRSMFEELRNSEIILLIIVSLKSGMKN